MNDINPAPVGADSNVSADERLWGMIAHLSALAGFKVENGAIAYPVDGITIAGNLRDMFAAIEAVGSEVDPRSHIRTGPILVGAMTVAGSSAPA